MRIIDATELPAGLFATAPSELKRELNQSGLLARFDDQEMILARDSACNYLPVVLSGLIRVFLSGETGREIILYDIYPEESCVLTANCIVAGSTFPVYAKTTGITDAFLIKESLVRSWMERYPWWRDYMFSISSRRLIEIIATLSEISFLRVDERVARLLIEKSSAGNELHITHEMLALEAATAREVISRILKQFEKQGFVSLGRGKITITNIKKLQKVVQTT